MSVTGNGIYAGSGGGVKMVTVNITGYTDGTWYIPSNGEKDINTATIIVPAKSIIVRRGNRYTETPQGSIVQRAEIRINTATYLDIFDVGNSGGILSHTVPIDPGTGGDAN